MKATEIYGALLIQHLSQAKFDYPWLVIYQIIMYYMSIQITNGLSILHVPFSYAKFSEEAELSELIHLAKSVLYWS